MDTGVLVAAADRTDSKHEVCAALVVANSGSLVTTAMVIAEAGYLLERELGSDAEVSLYRSIIEGSLRVEDLEARDWERVAQLVTTYADLALGGTDASLVAVAERLAAAEIATLDHRHFAVIRPAHVEAFELVP